MNCLTRFLSKAKLKKHKGVCVLQGTVIFPEKEKDKIMKFKNLQNKWRAPFVVYAECEEMLSNEQKRLFKVTYPNRTKYRSSEKLIPHLLPKSNYIAHHSLLMQALDNGLKIEKIHRVIECKEKPWLKQYIDFNTEKRMHATTKFMNDLYKLMNNAIYGKTMENARNHKKHKLVRSGDMERKYVRLPNFYNSIEITDEISIIQFKYGEVMLNKPIYVGLSILDISKTLMYNCHYEFMMKKFINDGVKPQLCYMDTDSFIYDIPMNHEERHSIILENQEEPVFYYTTHFCM